MGILYLRRFAIRSNTRLEEWIYNIKNMGRMQKIAFTIEDTFHYLKEVSDVAALTPADREVYEAELMKARDYNAVMKTAERKGLAEGMSRLYHKGYCSESEDVYIPPFFIVSCT
ncbi:MAG: Rpn family recombination-promoting nuclease/putative transposase [Muribaculaceae bacterium]|nr:Rpn family recombination-promoting nuclease/putative transposase [Muribaculaceae bacterium]